MIFFGFTGGRIDDAPFRSQSGEVVVILHSCSYLSDVVTVVEPTPLRDGRSLPVGSFARFSPNMSFLNPFASAFERNSVAVQETDSSVVRSAEKLVGRPLVPVRY